MIVIKMLILEESCTTTAIIQRCKIGIYCSKHAKDMLDVINIVKHIYVILKLKINTMDIV
jgi:hypothetical protein